MAQNETLEKKGLRNRQAVTIPATFKPRFWHDSDRRCAVVRTIRKRYQLLKEHCGGNESAQRDLLCQRLAFVSIILESKEVQCAEGEDLDLGSYVQGVNALVGLLRMLGLERRIKSVGGLRDYLEEKRKE